MGPPEDNSQYKIHEVEEIKVYIPQDIRAKRDTLSIKLSKFRGDEYIYIEGMAF